MKGHWDGSTKQYSCGVYTTFSTHIHITKVKGDSIFGTIRFSDNGFYTAGTSAFQGKRKGDKVYFYESHQIDGDELLVGGLYTGTFSDCDHFKGYWKLLKFNPDCIDRDAYINGANFNFKKRDASYTPPKKQKDIVIKPKPQTSPPEPKPVKPPVNNKEENKTAENKPIPKQKSLKIDQKNRAVVVQDSISVARGDIFIDVYDSGRIDGDVINMFVNGRNILDNYKVERAKKRLHFDFKPGNNEILIESVREGSIPPNSATLLIYQGKQFLKRVMIETDGSKSGVVKIYVR